MSDRLPPSNEAMRAWLEERGTIFYAFEGNRWSSQIVIKFQHGKCIPYDSIPSAYRRLHGVIK